MAGLQHQLTQAQAQIAGYQDELAHLIRTAQLKEQELRAANQQMQVFARDLKMAFDADRQKGEVLEQAYYDTLLRLTLASQYKDEETGARVERIGHYTKTLALYLGLGSTEAELLFAAAPMHDVGKIGIPDTILRKRSALDHEEWQVMRRHPQMGATLLKGSTSPILEQAREIALTHHERWDGSGYPHGLKGDSIPVSGRLIMLADQYDALRSQRSYKPAFDHPTVCDIILNGDRRTCPEHFDPESLTTFPQIHREFETIYADIPE